MLGNARYTIKQQGNCTTGNEEIVNRQPRLITLKFPCSISKLNLLVEEMIIDFNFDRSFKIIRHQQSWGWNMQQFADL